MSQTSKATAHVFDLQTGKCETEPIVQRRVSDLTNFFANRDAAKAAAEGDDPVVYEYYVLSDLEKTDGHVQYGTSIVLPGTVGGEYHMTKGHFHAVLETGEIYFCLSGQGYMLMESPEGDWEIEEFTPGRAVHVPPRYAHRSINTGTEPLVTFFGYRADAGQDYKTIEDQGFRKLVVEQAGEPVVVDNPRWKA